MERPVSDPPYSFLRDVGRPDGVEVLPLRLPRVLFVLSCSMSLFCDIALHLGVGVAANSTSSRFRVTDRSACSFCGVCGGGDDVLLRADRREERC